MSSADWRQVQRLRSDFWKRANQYIKEGLITRDQALTICDRPRKRFFWARHIRDLESFVAWKRTQQEDTTHDDPE